MPPIRANTVLPALRNPLRLQTADGLTLVGELALPVDRPPVATLVCLHPLPTHGGMMDSHVFRKAAWRLPALAGIAVLRFNTRGTSSVRGTSEGAFSNGVDERYDVTKELGQGAYGIVCAATNRQSGEGVAIKKVTNIFSKRILAKRALREIKLLQHFRGHRNITCLYDMDIPRPDNFNEAYLYEGE